MTCTEVSFTGTSSICCVRPHDGQAVHTDPSGTMVPGWVRRSEIRTVDSLSVPKAGMPRNAGCAALAIDRREAQVTSGYALSDQHCCGSGVDCRVVDHELLDRSKVVE